METHLNNLDKGVMIIWSWVKTQLNILDRFSNFSFFPKKLALSNSNSFWSRGVTESHNFWGMNWLFDYIWTWTIICSWASFWGWVRPRYNFHGIIVRFILIWTSSAHSNEGWRWRSVRVAMWERRIVCLNGFFDSCPLIN